MATGDDFVNRLRNIPLFSRAKPVEQDVAFTSPAPSQPLYEGEDLAQTFPLETLAAPVEFDVNFALLQLVSDLTNETRERDMARDAYTPNVDFDFLRGVEGFETSGYVPSQKGKVLGKSGVTIGSGIDLGQWNAEQLAQIGVTPELIQKVQPYLGKKKDEARKALSENKLKLAKEEAEELTTTVKQYYTDKVRQDFNKDSTRIAFEDLPPELTTAITSVAFQYGNPKTETPNFWKQITSGDFLGAYKNLRNFGDAYKTRRNKEADLIRPALVAMYGEEAINNIDKA